MNQMIHTLLSIQDKVFIIVMIILLAYIISVFTNNYRKELEILAFSGFAYYVGTKERSNIFNKQ